jgi:hypothetical protein
MTIQNWVGGVPLQHQPCCPDQEWWELNQSSRRDHVLDEVLAVDHTYAAGFCGNGSSLCHAPDGLRSSRAWTPNDPERVGTSEFGGRAEGDLLG